jgi:hypothetical protein
VKKSPKVKPNPLFIKNGAQLLPWKKVAPKRELSVYFKKVPKVNNHP